MDLKLDDKMPVNTLNAQAYLGLSLPYDEDEYKYGDKDKEAYELHHNFNDILQKNIEYDGKKFVNKTHIKVVQVQATEKNFRNLAGLLQKNFYLITQLEYLIRNIPIEDTEVQLDLIINHLKCHKPLKFILRDTYARDVNMYPDDYLLTLGDFVYKPHKFTINAYKNTAVISHLFVKLCHQAGLDSMKLRFSEEDTKFPESPYAHEGKTWLKSGSVAVVSESADIDSAVHTFLNSSKQTPWRLRKILVQESVYKEFKDALRWKCNLNKQENEEFTSSIPCSEVLVYDQRTFIIDPVDYSTISVPNATVILEAYRTNKELISLLLKQNVRFLSLWSNYIAEVNELTHSTKSPIVWVNSLADFRGPPQVAKAVYYDSYTDYTLDILRVWCYSKLCNLRQSWNKLDIQRRREILTEVLEKHIHCDQTKKDKILSALNECEMQSIVDVGKDYVCLVTSAPIGGIIDMRPDEEFVTEEIFKALLRGNAFLVRNRHRENFDPCIEFRNLTEAGVPAMYVRLVPIDDSGLNTDTYVRLYHRGNGTELYRAIWTNSGTIFAN